MTAGGETVGFTAGIGEDAGTNTSAGFFQFSQTTATADVNYPRRTRYNPTPGYHFVAAVENGNGNSKTVINHAMQVTIWH